MPGVFAWMRSAISVTTDFIYQTKEQAVSVYHTIHDFFSAPNNKPRLYQYLNEFWHGYYLGQDRESLTRAIKSERSRAVALELLSANLKYMATVMLYEMTIKPFIQSLPYIGNTPAETAVDIAAKIYFINLMLDSNIANAMRNAVHSSILLEENPNNDHFKTCHCSVADIIKSKGASFTYYLGTSNLLWAMSYIPVVKYVSFPARILFDAETMIESKLSSASMCNKHKRLILNSNLPFSFGMGIAYFLDYEITSFFLRYFTGVQSSFVEEALYNMVYFKYKTMTLMMTHPLPGKDEAIDVFRPSRALTRRLVKVTANYLFPRLQDSQYRSNLGNQIATVTQFPPIKLMINLFGLADLGSLQEFSQRPAIKLYLDVYQSSIVGAMQWIINLRHYASLKRVSMALPFVPKWLISKEFNTAMQVLMSKNLHEFLQWSKAKLDSLERNIVFYEEKPLIENIIHDYSPPPVPPPLPPAAKKLNSYVQIHKALKPVANIVAEERREPEPPTIDDDFVVMEIKRNPQTELRQRSFGR